MENIMEKYVEYVMGQIEKYSQYSKLIVNDEVRPQEINRALAEYMTILLTLISEYQRAKVKEFQIENEYDKWYDQCFVQVRNSMINESEAKTAKISIKEIDIQLHVTYKNEYNEWQIKLKEADYDVSFLLRLLEQFKKFDNILCNISNNMRTELRSLSLENRINDDPNKNKVRKEFPKRGE